MKKTWIKIVSTIILVCTLVISGSFSVYAYDVISSVTIPYVRTRHIQLIQDINQYYVSDIDMTVDLSPLELILDDNHDVNYGAEDGNVDTTYPSFIVMSKNNYTTAQAISRNLRAFNMEDLTQITATNNLGTNDIWVNIIDMLVENSTTYSYSGTSINYGTLYDLGYRLYRKSTVSYGNTTYYVYKINRFKAAESITFSGYEDIDIDVFHNNNVNIIFAQFYRWDFNMMNIRKTGQSNLYFEEGDFFKFVGVPFPVTDFLTYYDVYETNDCNFVDYDTSGNAFYINITGPNPYITFIHTFKDSGVLDNSERVKGNLSGDLYKGAGTDLTSVNNKLTEIIDLLSDLQITEIQNIYNDIQNNYDVDIDLELNNYLDDFTDGFNTLDFEDPNINVPESDVQKVGSFKIIFSNMMNTMNQSGIGILYFLPLILLIIGAII